MVLAIVSLKVGAQGPPITVDNPIMLGSQNIILRTLSEFRHTEVGNFSRVPLMVSYLPNSNLLVGAVLPYVNYDFGESNRGSTLGDISVFGKYQFYRNDMTAKTLRAVIKTVQTFPTGKELGIPRMSTGLYQSYLGAVLGYETIKYGISSELGYNLVPNANLDEVIFKVGFGLPLLRPLYPVNQLNLYFEYTNYWHTEHGEYELYYASGIQYAIGQLTIEAAVEVPLVRHLRISPLSSIYVGSTYVF